MADVKMDEFLLEFYRRLIFRSMPAEQFAQFAKYVKAKDFDGNMKDWAENLLQKDAAGNYIMVAGNYVPKDLPDPEDVSGDFHLTDDEWMKLFKAFQKTFQQMDANKGSFKYNDKANKFLKKWFGDAGQLFSYAKATPQAEVKIQELKNILTGHASALQQMLGQYFNDDFTWDDLISGINSKKYNKDPKFQDRLKNIANALDYDTKYNAQSPVLRIVGHQLDFDAIVNGFDGTAPSHTQIQEFKGIYSDLLKELYTNSDAYKAFQANDSSKISKKLEEAKSRVDYNDPNSKGYVPPKREDELTISQRLNDFWADIYENYLDKYVKLHGDRMFFSPQAKLIFAEIDKQKIKPTDGLDKILDNGNKIKDALKYKSPAAAKHMDWFIKTMGELKNTMKNAFAGALKDGRQMNALISEMIMMAVRNGKVAEAKTALEILSLVKYGYTTSKIMDTLGKTDLSIFSDKGLSWNKNEGVKFVTNAMDKSIKWAFQGIGYGITIAGNMYKLSGGKFNGKLGRMKNAHNTWVQQNDAARQNITNLRDNSVAQKTDLENNLANLRSRGLSEAAYDAAINRYQRAIAADKTAMNAQLQGLESWLMANQTSPDAPAIMQYIQTIQAGQPAPAPAVTDPAALHTVQSIQNIQQSIERQTAQMNRKISKRQDFDIAAQSIAMLDEQIQRRDTEIAEWDDKHKDQFKALMAHWDFLENGRNTHMGRMYSWKPFSKEKQQKKFDANKEAWMSQYLANYQVA